MRTGLPIARTDLLCSPPAKRVAARSGNQCGWRAGMAIDRPRWQAVHLVVRLPSGTVSFLLTDVEGSSLMWSRSPSEMGEVIARLSDFAVAGASEAGGTVLRNEERAPATSWYSIERPLR